MNEMNKKEFLKNINDTWHECIKNGEYPHEAIENLIEESDLTERQKGKIEQVFKELGDVLSAKDAAWLEELEDELWDII